MTDGKPAPAATSSGPIAQEIAKWLRDIRKGWTQSLDASPPPPSPNALSRPLRWVYGTSGSLTWLVSFTLILMARDSGFVNLILSYGLTELILTGLIISAWFGWLIAFVDRKCGPVRLFVDGLLLPAVAVTIIGLSVTRIPPFERESSPVTLTRSEASNQSSQDTSGAERSEEDSSESPN